MEYQASANARPDPKDGIGERAHDEIVERIARWRLGRRPILHTRLGLPGERNAEFPDYSDAAMCAEVTEIDTRLRLLEEARPAARDDRARIDIDAMRAGLKGELLLHAGLPFWRHKPHVFVREASMGIHLLLLRSEVRTEERAHWIASRLRALPNFLATARAQLHEPAPGFTEDARMTATSLSAYLKNTVAGFYLAIEDAALAREGARAIEEARRALAQFVEYLTGDLMLRSRGLLTIGKARFDALLRDRQCLSLTADEAVELGQEGYHSALRALRNAAKDLGMPGNWSDAVRLLEADVILGDELSERVRSEIDRARAFVCEHDLVGVPAGDEVLVTTLPPMLQHLYPQMNVEPAPVFSSSQRSMLRLLSAGDEEAATPPFHGTIRGAVPFAVVHEIYPGHHIEHLHARRDRRMARLLFRSDFSSEAWCAYGEALMADEGFFDPIAHFFFLRARLWRSCRVLVDVGLNTGTMSEGAAVEFLIRKAKLPRGVAVREVRRHAGDPTQPASYLLGERVLRALRDRARAEWRESFSQRRFHDAVLREGPLPLGLLGSAIGL